MSRKKKQKKKSFKKIFKYTIEDIVYDIEDEEEVAYLEPYVGTYILRRMTFGDQRAIETGLVKIQTSMKGKSIEIDDVVPDLSNWQSNILVFSIYSCPFGVRPKGGWLKGDTDGINEFLYDLPKSIGDKLLDSALILNEFTEEDQKN